MEHVLHILHYTLFLAVGVQLGLGEQPFSLTLYDRGYKLSPMNKIEYLIMRFL